MQFQPNIGGSSIGSSTLPIEPSLSVSPHGLNVGASSNVLVPSTEPVRRKRGRPRKYGPEGTMSLALSTPTSSTPPATTTTLKKRGRGRPPGTGRKQQLASLGEWLSDSAGMGFTPHVITIAVGEQRSRAICVLSANGSISAVTLQQPSTSGGSITYEGRFEILCLSGSYLVTDNSSPQGRTGGLSISLASPDGRVIGGGVGGMLIAASPVQVIVGSFLWGTSKTKNKAGRGHPGQEGGGGLDSQRLEDPVAPPPRVSPNPSLTQGPSVGVWPGSRPMDMQAPQIDIDLMRE
ncbi:hypothetical protein NMG60_11029066 [Bertholletia excelsa]